jgi:hypothetical protein
MLRRTSRDTPNRRSKRPIRSLVRASWLHREPRYIPTGRWPGCIGSHPRGWAVRNRRDIHKHKPTSCIRGLPNIRHNRWGNSGCRSWCRTYREPPAQPRHRRFPDRSNHRWPRPIQSRAQRPANLPEAHCSSTYRWLDHMNNFAQEDCRRNLPDIHIGRCSGCTFPLHCILRNPRGNRMHIRTDWCCSSTRLAAFPRNLENNPINKSGYCIVRWHQQLPRWVPFPTGMPDIHISRYRYRIPSLALGDRLRTMVRGSCTSMRPYHRPDPARIRHNLTDTPRDIMGGSDHRCIR